MAKSAPKTSADTASDTSHADREAADLPPLPAVENLRFEAAMSELEAIVSDLEAGRSTLDELVTRYTRGSQLLRRSRELLGQAELKLSQLADNTDPQS